MNGGKHGARSLATLEIVPRAMSDLHLLLAALAKQTQAWRIEAK